MVAGPSSPYRRLSEIVGGNLPSLLSFRSAGGGTWAVASCRTDVARLAHFSQWSGQHIRIGYAIVWVWCSRVSCAFPWGSPDRGACHMSSWGVRMELLQIAMRATCHQGEGSLQLWWTLFCFLTIWKEHWTYECTKRPGYWWWCSKHQLLLPSHGNMRLYWESQISI